MNAYGQLLSQAHAMVRSGEDAQAVANWLELMSVRLLDRQVDWDRADVAAEWLLKNVASMQEVMA